MPCLPGGRSRLRAFLKAAHLHAHIHFQGLVTLIHGLIALSGVTSGVPLQYCQLALHQLCVVRCRGGLLRVPLSVFYLEGRQGQHVSSAYCQKKPLQVWYRGIILGSTWGSATGSKAC